MKNLVLIVLALAGMLFANLQYGGYAQAASQPSCKTECLKCATTCDNTLRRCKTAGGTHKDADHVRALQDCASLCKLSADFIARKSSMAQKVCDLCAQACDTCAESCETFQGDKAMQSCAHECRTCAETCRSMGG